MNENVITGGINRQRQAMPIGDRSSVDKQIILLPLHHGFSGQFMTLDDLQIVKPSTNSDEEQAEDELPDSQPPERRARLAQMPTAKA